MNVQSIKGFVFGQVEFVFISSTQTGFLLWIPSAPVKFYWGGRNAWMKWSWGCASVQNRMRHGVCSLNEMTWARDALFELGLWDDTGKEFSGNELVRSGNYFKTWVVCFEIGVKQMRSHGSHASISNASFRLSFLPNISWEFWKIGKIGKFSNTD